MRNRGQWLMPLAVGVFLLVAFFAVGGAILMWGDDGGDVARETNERICDASSRSAQEFEDCMWRAGYR